jgi:hypothetical protein
MRSKITLLVGLSTVLLFLNTYTMAYVNGQSSSQNNETSNADSEKQTENSDPFMPRGSENNINTDSTNNPSQDNDGSTNNNNDDDNKKSDDSKSSEDKDSESKDDDKKFELPFP